MGHLNGQISEHPGTAQGKYSGTLAPAWDQTSEKSPKMEARFLHESEARASSGVLPAAESVK
jgi:hypothetical protein